MENHTIYKKQRFPKIKWNVIVFLLIVTVFTVFAKIWEPKHNIMSILGERSHNYETNYKIFQSNHGKYKIH